MARKKLVTGLEIVHLGADLTKLLKNAYKRHRKLKSTDSIKQ